MSKQDRRDREKDRQAANQARPPSRLAEYFWANVVFWVFLALLTLITWASCQDPSDNEAVKYVLGDTFKFILLLFGVGFTLVTCFDWAYDFFASRAQLRAAIPRPGPGDPAKAARAEEAGLAEGKPPLP